MTENKENNVPHVLHFDGHGLFAKRCKSCQAMIKKVKDTNCPNCKSQLPQAQGYLVFEDNDGGAKYISAEEMGTLLQQSSFDDSTNKTDGVTIIVLSACQSAMTFIGDSVFNGTAQNLISHRIPAVVAMQYSVNVEAAAKFTEQFYRSLGQKNSLAIAISQGRESMGIEGNQWYRPVLYLRWQDNEGGQLFAVTKSVPRGIPFQAPPLPTYYVDRPECIQDLKKRLLTESNDVRTLVVTAIHGLGSVGKSTIATALAHDEAVKAHFCDGILWATLGQDPNLLSLLSGWINALGDYNFQPSVEAATNRLRTLLNGKAVLLVVDDAWNTTNFEAFKVGEGRCQVLVTTRESASIAQVLGASTYSLDVMTENQAMELLTKKLKQLNRSITGEEYPLASKLAKAVGYLPLALELAAAQVASDKKKWDKLLEDFQQEVARLKTLNSPGVGEISNEDESSLKRLSLQASLNLSVKTMTTTEQGYFSWLGVLPEDVTITEMMAATLWEMDEKDTAETLQYLETKSLLLPGVPLVDGTPTYRLHDLFHDLARNLLTSPPNPKHEGDLPGLGITLPDAHAAFLEKYRKKTTNELWHTLSNDGYIHQHLVWHLEKAEKVEEIHLLLGEGWYEACDRLGQTANFVTDVARAWQLAEKSWTETTLDQVIGLQCRYALIITSLNSLAANLPIELLIALIQKEVWTPEQGLAYVLQRSNLQQKANLLTNLVNHLPSNLKELGLSKALAAAREIGDERDRAQVLSSLADQLPPELLPEALAAAREIGDERDRAKVLSSLADQLPELLPEALAAAREIRNERDRAKVLSSLADQLLQVPKTQLFCLWQDTLHILSVDTRPNLLSDLKALTPVIFTLGGEQAVKDTASAIQDVSRWWS